MKAVEVVICVAIAGIVASNGLSSCSYVNVQESKCTVNNKESVSIKGTNQYRVYTTCGTYKVADDVARLRFDSADVYGSLIPGQTYTFKTSGYRFGLFSMFPNILEFRTEK